MLSVPLLCVCVVSVLGLWSGWFTGPVIPCLVRCRARVRMRFVTRTTAVSACVSAFQEVRGLRRLFDRLCLL
jgi:hypothetical protein